MKQWPANSLGLCSKALIDEIDVSGAEISLTPIECLHLRFRGVNIAINGTFTTERLMELFLWFWRITGDGKFLNEIDNKNKTAKKLRRVEKLKNYTKSNWRWIKNNNFYRLFANVYRRKEHNDTSELIFKTKLQQDKKRKKDPGTGQMMNIWEGRTYLFRIHWTLLRLRCIVGEWLEMPSAFSFLLQSSSSLYLIVSITQTIP